MWYLWFAPVYHTLIGSPDRSPSQRQSDFVQHCGYVSHMDEIEKIVSNNLNIYKKFIDDFNFRNEYVKCLFLNTYNHFLAAKILADAGLRCQSYNCLRMGLESEWLGICIVNHRELSLQWAFGTGDDETLKMIKKLESPADLRR